LAHRPARPRPTFRLCNNTASRVGVAVGYKDAEGWTTEGWWNLPSRSCETVLKGNLVARYYYVYAIDYDHGGEWMGTGCLCAPATRNSRSAVSVTVWRAVTTAAAFSRWIPASSAAWTVQLTESSEQSPQHPLPAGNRARAGPV
jgi:uncharacterized membrane protein